MNDRKLLELAAKAGGISGEYDFLFENIVVYDNDYQKGEYLWNPLTDDGDAFRLAVKLGLSIDQRDSVAVAGDFRATPVLVANETHNQDPYAATRRAIVRAAAEVGKDMRPFPSVEEIEQLANMDGKPEWMK